MEASPASSPVVQLKDTSGRIYNVLRDNPLGQGGQGEVLRVADDRYLAVKLAFTQDPQEIKDYQEHMSALRYLPLSPQLRLSMPLAILQDSAGYVMRLLGSMQPLKRLMPNQNRRQDIPVPAWLQQTLGKAAPYSASGGLRLRLSLLLQLAELLGALHEQGLLFADLSPNNVYVSADSSEVWLIDVDNICYEGSKQLHFYTPDYGAPELVLGQGCNSQDSDVFSFALLSFELLTMVKPFEGKAADDQDFGESTGIEFPWILDQHDQSNSIDASNLMLLPYLLSKPLLALFAQTFEEGKDKPNLRPPLWIWRYTLSSTLDVTVRCPHCGMSWVFTEHESTTCPFCDTQLTVLTAHSDGSLVYAHECTQDPFYLPTRLFAPVTTTADVPCLQVTLLSEQRLRLSLTAVKQEELLWALAGQKQQKLNSVVSAIEVALPTLQEQELVLQSTHEPRWQVSLTVRGNLHTVASATAEESINARGPHD